MSIYWWIALGLVAGCFGLALLGGAVGLWRGEEGPRRFAAAWARWGVVFALAALIIVIFKHLILTLLGPS